VKKTKMNKRLLLPVIAILLSMIFIQPSLIVAKPVEQTEPQMWIINGPPTPPVDVSETVVASSQLIERLSAGSSIILDGVPTSEWTYGCTATSAGMLFGYYDRHGYPNMYTGPANGGVCPLTDLGQGIPANINYPIPGSCYIIATENGLDGITTTAHVDDYWTGVDDPGPDPWEGNWAEHTWGLCTADYLGTNQWKWDFDDTHDGVIDANNDGGTTFWTYSDGSKLYDYVPPAGYGLPQTSCCHGMRLFAESRGYTVLTNYNQKTDNIVAAGFSFADFQAEIDAGRPVMIHASSATGGHTMLALGYDTSTNEIYIHDTWSNVRHTMTWGGTYGGFTLQAVTVIQLEPMDSIPPTTTKTVGDPQYGDYVTTLTPITLEATDNPGGSGVKEIHYTINGVETVTTGDTVTFTFAEECTHNLEFWAVDNAGCTETPHAQTHYVDDTPPTTGKSYGLPYYTDGTTEWITSGTSISLTPADEGSCSCGVQETEYQIGGGGWTTYNGAFSISGPDGPYVIDHRSTDNLGNVETVKTQVVNLDNTPPSVEVVYPPDGFVYGLIKIQIDATDDGSGVWYAEYSLDESTWIPTTYNMLTGHYEADWDTTILPDGDYTVYARAYDNLGNEGTDPEPPEVTIVLLELSTSFTDSDFNTIEDLKVNFNKQKPPMYKVSTNPGTIYQIIEITNIGSTVTLPNLELHVSIPIEADFLGVGDLAFETQGAKPVHIYLNGVDVTPKGRGPPDLNPLIAAQALSPGDTLKWTIHYEYAFKGESYSASDIDGWTGEAYDFKTEITSVSGPSWIETLNAVIG
jgi:hypothetical protein